jgi:hypothetical protein
MAADFTLSRSRRFVVVGTGDFSIQPKGGILRVYDHEEEVHQVNLRTRDEAIRQQVLATLDRISLGIDAGSRIYRARRTSRL